MKLNPDNARHLQAAQRTTTAAQKRLESAGEEGQIVESAEGLLAADSALEAAKERCRLQLRKDEEKEAEGG